MSRYRLSRFLLITLEDPPSSESSPNSILVITSIVSGQHLLTNADELRRLQEVSSSKWTDTNRMFQIGFSSERLAELESLGILHYEGRKGAFFEREERLVNSHWPPMAAAFHLLNDQQENMASASGKVIDMALQEKNAEAKAASFLATHGPPPPEFYRHPQAQQAQPLPLSFRHSRFTSTLLARRTCRHFQSGKPVSRRNLSTLLRLTFGPFRLREVSQQIRLLLKSSPSGGSLHPVEAFPIIFDCQGQDSGIYHYQAESHSLALLRREPSEVLRRWTTYFAQGQDFVGSCSFVVVLVARFDRNYWKYQERENSYAVVLQDAGHLSQTFQLAATDLRLGSFYTAAVRGESLADFLGLKFPVEAPLGILGVGHSRSDAETGAPALPFQPRR